VVLFGGIKPAEEPFITLAEPPSILQSRLRLAWKKMSDVFRIACILCTFQIILGDLSEALAQL
tara:strand:- start:1409 stop:1597 length:189 start_codon:yes stop_codon:yes gene_type:complete